ncbi:MAG TPA: PEGA domain-containing protein [Polyangia bacterium]|jgi:hypothetical protein|nr:PEGA domain-containing protein [Polyangia bacterium]
MRRVSLLAGLVWLGFALAPRVAFAADADPNAAADHYSRGAKALEDGDAAAAVTELTASLAAKPSLRAYLSRAEAEVKLGRFDDARADYEAALRLEPTTHKRAAIEHWLHDLATGTRTRLAIASTPPGATVYVDLKAAGKRGVTPVVLPTPPGRHRVILELDGYEPFVAREVNAVENAETPLMATLDVKGCDLRATATPATATIALDGGAPLPSPLTARVRGGEHALAFAAPDRLPRQKTIRCEIGTPLDVAETLEPLPPARIVVALPPGGRVRVDGRDAATPALVAAGEHSLAVEAPDRAPWQTTLHVDAGQDIRIEPRLDARPRRNNKKWLLIGGGIAVAGIAIGLGVGLGVGLSDDAAPVGHFGGFHIFGATVGGGSK